MRQSHYSNGSMSVEKRKGKKAREEEIRNKE